ncbi:hypothetical protein CS022_16855 [Veronia nyctiphanis]|uniref:Uncharacterized protein n=1 Tax=Veronia nyctiphanis TaxID=1278244 RepID=A0A4Q0YSY1_9GAMM|nr:chitinase N-terminal domain-containing protein [Veronia nyctiphanis]RXJ72219.1 hypothetical protein CS022_16855 [Veronia nyctiphanis]
MKYLLLLSAIFSTFAFAEQAPAKPKIGWLKDIYAENETLTVNWQIPYGKNGDHWYLFDNSEQIHQESLIDTGNATQTGSFNFSAVFPGEHYLQVSLCHGTGNHEVCTRSDLAKYIVTSQDSVNIPAKPQLGQLASDIETAGEHDLSISWNKWWGNNGNHWNLYINDQKVQSHSLIKNNSQQQSDRTTYTMLNSGKYNVQVALCDSNGFEEKCTLSDSFTVNFTNTEARADFKVVTKALTSKFDKLGDTVKLTSTITNTGTKTLTSFVLNNSDIVSDDALPAKLEAGQSATFIASHQINAENMEKNEFLTNIHLTASEPNGHSLSRLSDDPTNPADIDSDNDGYPDDPVVILRKQKVTGLKFSEISMAWAEIVNTSDKTIDLSDVKFIAENFMDGAIRFDLPKRKMRPNEYLVIRFRTPYYEENAGQKGKSIFIDSIFINQSVGQGMFALESDNELLDYVQKGETDTNIATEKDWQGLSIYPLGSIPRTTDILIRRGDIDHNDRSDWEVKPLTYSTVGGPNDVFDDTDTDNDGIPDSAERQGGSLAGISYYDLGARVGQRDLFIEIDWMKSDDPMLSPMYPSLKKVQRAFANQGISVHFDTGNLFGSEFNLAGGEEVPFRRRINMDLNPSDHDANIYEYKDRFMDIRRSSVFHYLLIANTEDINQRNSGSGRAEIGGNDFYVTLGEWTWDELHDAKKRKNRQINVQAATIMHELGHNLNLRHGGFENRNYKPNYYSIMNYLYQINGMPDAQEKNNSDRYASVARALLSHGPYSDPNQFIIDYSHGLSPAIDEKHIDENAGIFGNHIPFDANFDGHYDSDVARELNRDGSLDVIKDHDDWNSINLEFQIDYTEGTYSLFDINTSIWSDESSLH